MVNLVVTVALVPALFRPGEPDRPGPVAVRAGATLETVPVVATAAAGRNDVVVLGPHEIAAEAATTTTTTTAPPAPTTSTTAARPTATRPAPAPTTTTTAKPRPASTTTTTAAPAADGTQAGDRSESGKASWYDHEPGICAHKSLPFGTVVTVTNTNNGRSVTCTVGDRGPYVDGWIIDLNPREFERLAPLSTGVIPVRITW